MPIDQGKAKKLKGPSVADACANLTQPQGNLPIPGQLTSSKRSPTIAPNDHKPAIYPSRPDRTPNPPLKSTMYHPSASLASPAQRVKQGFKSPVNVDSCRLDAEQRRLPTSGGSANIHWQSNPHFPHGKSLCCLTAWLLADVGTHHQGAPISNQLDHAQGSESSTTEQDGDRGGQLSIDVKITADITPLLTDIAIHHQGAPISNQLAHAQASEPSSLEQYLLGTNDGEGGEQLSIDLNITTDMKASK